MQIRFTIKTRVDDGCLFVTD